MIPRKEMRKMEENTKGNTTPVPPKKGRMNRKFTERVPLIAGRLTFIPELTREAMRHAKNCPGSGAT